MTQTSIFPPTTTFLLLKSHEPSCPPSITDAGSQAGQAFNQLLRCIASTPGFQTQLFGWPWQDESQDVNMNDWMASIMPGFLGIFIDWNDERSAMNFLSASSLAQAFQGLTVFFEVPKGVTKTASPALDKPLAVNIVWKHGDAVDILRRTKLPLQVSIAHTEDMPPDWTKPSGDGAAGSITGQAESNGEGFLRINHVSPEAMPSTAPHDGSETIVLSLMRTRYCSRLKKGLYDMIRARRVE